MSGSARDKVPALGELSLIVQKYFSRVQLFSTLWTIAHQTPLSMEFSREEYWSGEPVASPGDLSDPGVTPRSPAWQADTLLSRLSHQWLDHRRREILNLGTDRQKPGRGEQGAIWLGESGTVPAGILWSCE